MNIDATIVQRRFDREAGKWSSLYGQTPSRSIYLHNLRRRRRHALQLLSGTTGRVLEVGCGAGNVALSLEPRTDLRVFGIDFSRGMLKQAQANARDQERSFPVAASDARFSPFASDTFDAVLCLGVLEYISDYREAARECHRVLRPGGQFIASVPNVSSPFIRLDDLALGIKNTATHSLPCPIRSWLKTQVFGKTDQSYYSHRKRRFVPKAFKSALENIGFHVTETRFHTFGFGILDGVGANVTLSEHIESRPDRSGTMEKLGWTCILKAIKS